MASLTETAYYTRRAINWIAIGVVAYIVLRIVWSIIITLYIALFPPKPPPPTNAFGKLPILKFASPSSSPSGQLIFQLQTISGTVPEASATATVFFMPKPPANLLALNKAQDFAQRLDMDYNNPIQESKNIYRFNDPQFPARRLRYDIVSNNFILRYSFEADPGVFSQKDLPTASEAIAESRSLLQTYALYKDDFAEGNTIVSYLKLSGVNLIKTSSLSQSDAVRVDFFRKSIDGMPLLTPNADEAPVSIIFSGSRDAGKRLIQFAYNYWPIDYTASATYALKTSQAAWSELQGGGGAVVRYPQKGGKPVVRNIYLAYYDSFEPQTYLQPIFVFEGDDGFLAYVQAVDLQWISQ